MCCPAPIGKDCLFDCFDRNNVIEKDYTLQDDLHLLINATLRDIYRLRMKALDETGKILFEKLIFSNDNVAKLKCILELLAQQNNKGFNKE
jgi:hypothetical protein